MENSYELLGGNIFEITRSNRVSKNYFMAKLRTQFVLQSTLDGLCGLRVLNLAESRTVNINKTNTPPLHNGGNTLYNSHKNYRKMYKEKPSFIVFEKV